MSVTAPAQTELEFLDYMIRHCCRALIASETPDSQAHWYERLGFYLGKKKALGVVP
jgi:hypothetical protein